MCVFALFSFPSSALASHTHHLGFNMGERKYENCGSTAVHPATWIVTREGPVLGSKHRVQN